MTRFTPVPKIANIIAEYHDAVNKGRVK
jgi:hypothetical protein